MNYFNIFFTAVSVSIEGIEGEKGNNVVKTTSFHSIISWDENNYPIKIYDDKTEIVRIAIKKTLTLSSRRKNE